MRPWDTGAFGATRLLQEAQTYLPGPRRDGWGDADDILRAGIGAVVINEIHIFMHAQHKLQAPGSSNTPKRLG